MKLSLLQHPGGDRPLPALALLLMGVFVLALQDSLVKLMSSDTSFWQFQTLRSIGNLSFIVILALASGSLGLMMPKNWRPVYLRAALLTVCMFFFFAGAPFLSVPQMAAGLYTYPLFVSLLAAPVLGERVGVWRVGALLVGTIGAAFVLSPWHEDFSTVQILPIIAGFFYATNILTLRRACRTESPLALAFAVGLAFIVCGCLGIVLLTTFPLAPELRESMPFVAIGWPELTLTVGLFAIFASVLNLTGNICLSRAYQTADASWLAPMDFSYLIFAALWSRAIFDQWPSSQALIGMSLIGAAGVITAWRERVAATGKRIRP
ncbi:MAG: DMT family transporter [Gammaproteobacteria bacterium]|nr:DMT family transporter [Gammaproteobacteria bacterium]